MDLANFHGRFDAIVLSEVLEHLADPWLTVKRLATCLKPGGSVIASSPNVCHRSVILKLFRGQFDYAEAGVMDRSHLRWFTPSSYEAVFTAAGFETIHLGPIRKPGALVRMFNALTGQRFKHLSMSQILFQGRLH